MAKANQCDICKSFYVIKWNSVVIEIKRGNCTQDYYDVCPECAKKIQAFINGETEELK